MLVKRDAKEEDKRLNTLIDSNAAIKAQHEDFVSEMLFKQKLIDIRKEKKMTQKEVGERSGLSQQAVSRLEKGKGATIETVIKYLTSLGYSLDVKQG